MNRWIVIGLCCLVAPVFLSAQSKEDLQQQKQKAFDEIKLARELMEKTATERSTTLQQIRLLQRGINVRSRLISTLEQEVALIDADIVATQEQVKRLEAENKRNREEYARLIYYAYRNHTNYEKLMYILAGENISQSYQRYKYLKYIGEYRVKKASEIERLVVELEEKEQELNGFRAEKLALMEAKEGEQRTLLGERSRHSTMVSQLRRQENQLKKEIEEKERIARELEARIREIIEEEARRLSADNIYAALTPEQQIVSTDFRRNKGKLPWPVDKGIVTTGFGNNEVEGLRGSSIKNIGIDINSAPGTQVRTVFDGEVTNVIAILGANYAVLVRHGEFFSVYQNLVNVRVKKGDKVLRKEVLGDAFVDDQNDIASMHFQVWENKTILNPEEWLSK